MRQTSKAVLLLISAASAANPDFTAVAGAVTPTLLNQGAWTGYIGKPIYRHLAADTNLTAVLVEVQATNNNASSHTDGEKSCIKCMKGKISGKRTVWCSAAWNYEYVDLPLATAYPAVKTGASGTVPATFQLDGKTTTGKGDLGACCYSADVFKTMADTDNDSTDTTFVKRDLFNKWNCPAKFTSDWLAAGAKGELANITMATTNWWCSDGSYNLKDDAAYGTKGATASANEEIIQPTRTSPNKKPFQIANLYLDEYTKDRRDELLYAQCRQKNLLCGGAAKIVESGTDAERKRTVSADDTNGFDADEKCTWVLRSKTKAPTFVISNAAGKALENKVDVVYQEWVDGWQIEAGKEVITGYDDATPTIYVHGGVPNFAMIKATYDKAYKFGYNGASYTGSPWEDNGSNNSQRAGEAWVYQSRGVGCVAGKTGTGSDKNDAGTADNDCFKNKTAKRWISLDVSGATYTNAVKDAYDSALSTFNTNAASYNKYLADLKTANEKDAFSAFFSPPKKPAMVKRPGAPTKPAAYTGLAHWPVADQKSMLTDSGGAPATKGKSFVLGNNNFGGWGAWTISQFTNIDTVSLETYTISHSFGMLGVSNSKTAATSWSYLKNWQKGNTSGAMTTVEIKGSHTGNIMCASATTTASHTCIPTATKTTVNTKYVYLNVSVWANQALAKNAFTSAVSVQFYASSWADGKAYYAPAAAADGTALTEPAGAHALAASAAAVVAVAAALY